MRAVYAYEVTFHYAPGCRSYWTTTTKTTAAAANLQYSARPGGGGAVKAEQRAAVRDSGSAPYEMIDVLQGSSVSCGLSDRPCRVSVCGVTP